MDLNRALDYCFDASLDSDTDKIGEWHSLSVALCLLDNAFSFDGENITERGLEILREVLFFPKLRDGAFDPDYVESEKKLNLDEIAALVNNKARYARSRMYEHMCRLEPYSVCPLGNPRELKKIDARSLAEYYFELMKTARIEVFFVGRFDREAVKQATEEMFAGMERDPLPLPCASIRTSARAVKEITETMDITQANLVMGFRTGCTVYDDDWRAVSLYNSVLGGSLTSKLFTVLREKMSLCYSISSYPDALKGVLHIYAGIAPEKRDVSVKEALHQMEEIKKGSITSEELESARGAIIHGMKGLEDNPAALADWYLPRVLADRVVTPEEVIRQVRAITKEDVMRAAERITLDTVYTLTAKEAK